MKKNENDPIDSEAMPFTISPRCGAKTRSGAPCKNPRVGDGKGGYRPRCRMHGCGRGSGGQPGNQNALKHGQYTREAQEELKRERGEIAIIREVLKKLDEML